MYHPLLYFCLKIRNYVTLTITFGCVYFICLGFKEKEKTPSDSFLEAFK